MKKIFIWMMAAVFVLNFTACGSSEETTEIKNESMVTPESKEATNTKQEDAETVSETDLPNVYKVPMKNIYINAPGFQKIEQAYTELFIVQQEKYVAITAARQSTATDPEDAHAKVFEIFDINMDNYEGGVNRIDISRSETKSVGDLEVYYFEGTINYGTDNIYDGYAVGYSFIMDGIPCEIIGSVLGEEQADTTKDEISKIVDEMMASVRAEQ